MIILDTCALIFDSLNPEKLTSTAKKAILNAEKNNQLYCCDISLWEIAMLVQKKRVDPGTDVINFLKLILQARDIQVLNITLEIAALSVEHLEYTHFDPADRLIASSAMHYNASLVTADKKLRVLKTLSIIW